MSIDLNTAENSDVIEHYGLTALGLADLVTLIGEGLEIGALTLDDEDSAYALVEGFKQGLRFTEGEDVPNPGFRDAVRFVVDLYDQAKAADRITTVRSIGLTVADVAISLIQRDADAGNEEAQEALAHAKNRGLL